MDCIGGLNRSCLSSAQDDLSAVLDEKRSLLELVQSLKAVTSIEAAKVTANARR